MVSGINVSTEMEFFPFLSFFLPLEIGGIDILFSGFVVAENKEMK